MKNYLNAFNNLLIVNIDENEQWALVMASNMVVRTILEEKKYYIVEWGVEDGHTIYAVATSTDEYFFGIPSGA